MKPRHLFAALFLLLESPFLAALAFGWLVLGAIRVLVEFGGWSVRAAEGAIRFRAGLRTWSDDRMRRRVLVIGAVVGLGALGLIVSGVYLWGPGRQEAQSTATTDLGLALLGGGLAFLGGGVVAAAVFYAQRLLDRQAARQSLQLTIGTQPSLFGIDLREQDLSGFYLRQKDLGGANLAGANLAGADLANATLTGADLTGALLTTAVLIGEADLERAILARADLEGADLSAANLADADLTDANLTGAILADATLAGANLRGATLVGADLAGADLSDVDYDSRTKWPEGFEPPAIAAGGEPSDL